MKSAVYVGKGDPMVKAQESRTVGGLFVVDGPEAFVRHLLKLPEWAEFDEQSKQPKPKRAGGVPSESEKKEPKAALKAKAREAVEE